MKKVSKLERRPEGKIEKAVKKEQLLNALRNYISKEQSKANQFHFERTQQQNLPFERFMQSQSMSMQNISVIVSTSLQLYVLTNIMFFVCMGPSVTYIDPRVLYAKVTYLFPGLAEKKGKLPEHRTFYINDRVH